MCVFRPFPLVATTSPPVQLHRRVNLTQRRVEGMGAEGLNRPAQFSTKTENRAIFTFEVVSICRIASFGVGAFLFCEMGFGVRLGDLF